MKKFIFLLPLFLMYFSSTSVVLAESHLKKIDSNTTGTFTIKKDSDNSLKDSTYSLHHYAKISLRGAEFSGAYKIPTSVFGKNTEFDNFAIGGSVFLKELLRFPLTISAGKLTISGSLSRLKTPTINSGTACFSSCASSATGLSSTLPGSGSTSKPWSATIRYDYANTNGVLKNVRAVCFYDEKNNFGESLLCVLKPHKKIHISFSETVGLFSIENLSPSSWFSAWGFFPKRHILSANAQAAINTPYYKVRFSTNFYQIENHTVGSTFSIENSIVFPNFKLNAWGFYSASPQIFTTSSTKLKTMWQAKINPVVNFITPSKMTLIKLGGVFYIDEKMDSPISSSLSYKWSGGASIRQRVFSSTLSATGTQSYYTVSESTSFYTFLRPRVSSTYTLSMDEKENTVKKHRIKNSITIQFPSRGGFSLNAKESFELTFKDGGISGANALSLCFKQKVKKTNISASLNIHFQF